MKNMQCNPYLWANCLNFRVLYDIGIVKHDGDVRFKTGSGNMTVSCMGDKNMHYNRYYRNSSVIADLAMGQIQRSTERISSSNSV